MIDSTIRVVDVLTADPRELQRIIRQVPAVTIANAIRRARRSGRPARAIYRMMEVELERRINEAEARQPILVEIPPFGKATPIQRRGALLLAGLTVKDVADAAGVTQATIYRIIAGETRSERVTAVIIKAIKRKLQSK